MSFGKRNLFSLNLLGTMFLFGLILFVFLYSAMSWFVFSTPVVESFDYDDYHSYLGYFDSLADFGKKFSEGRLIVCCDDYSSFGSDYVAMARAMEESRDIVIFRSRESKYHVFWRQ